jgi:CRP/FNR family transcriptional regulator, cyclic AMP receptor protein
MRSPEDLLEQVDALDALAPEHRATIAGCARLAVFEPGDYLLREGEPAGVFYVIRKGAVALETYVPRRGAVTLQTLHDHDLLGWSWLIPPYRVAFDARALEQTRAIAFDASCLRDKCDRDPALGYDLLKLFAGVVVARLQNTRVQLLDLYDDPARG